MSALTLTCRVCMRLSDANTDIFNKFNNLPLVIAEAIMACAPVHIIENDNLPRSICQKCTLNLQIAYDFRELSLRSDRQFRDTVCKVELKDETQDWFTSSLDGNYDSLAVKVSVDDDQPLTELFTTDEKCLAIVDEPKPKDTSRSKSRSVRAACPKCNKTVLKRHLKRHKCPKPKIKNEFRDESTAFDVNAEILKVQPNAQGLYPCTRCDYRPLQKARLYRHWKTGACSKRSRRLSDQHSESYAYDMQRKQLLEQNGFVKDDAGRFRCPVCDKSFAHKYHLIRHSIAHSQFTFPCDQCDKTFHREANLELHRVTHSDERPYNCEYCGKTFKCDASLRCHQRAHLGLRPYKCTVCDKRFGWKRLLKEHTRLHTGERPHACPICAKTFNNKRTLERHAMVHIGLKPFACRLCDMLFSRRQQLAWHQRKHNAEPLSNHAAVLYKCEKCAETFDAIQLYCLHMNEKHHFSVKPSFLH